GEPWLKPRKRLAAAGFRMDGDQVVAAPQRAAPDDGVGEMLRGLLGKGAPPAPRRKPAPAPPAAAAPIAPPPAAPDPPPVQAAAPIAPPSPAPRFNPLEIGELVESEEAAAGAPPPDPFPFVAPPAAAPPAGASSLDDTGLSWL